MTTETRPVLFITYSRNDPDDAPVLDVSSTLEDARNEARLAKRRGFVYRVERAKDGTYGNELFIEELK